MTTLFADTTEMLQFKQRLEHFMANPGTIWIWGILDKEPLVNSLAEKLKQVGILDHHAPGLFSDIPNTHGYIRTIPDEMDSEIWLVKLANAKQIASIGLFQMVKRHTITIFGD